MDGFCCLLGCIKAAEIGLLLLFIFLLLIIFKKKFTIFINLLYLVLMCQVQNDKPA